MVSRVPCQVCGNNRDGDRPWEHRYPSGDYGISRGKHCDTDCEHVQRQWGYVYCDREYIYDVSLDLRPEFRSRNNNCYADDKRADR